MTIDTEFRFYEKEGGRALRGENFGLFQTIVKECQNKKIFPADFITHSYYDKKHEFFDLVVSDKSWEFDFAQEFFLNMIKESRQNNFLFIETFLKSGRIDLLSFDKTMTEDALFVAARFGRRDVIELFFKTDPNLHYLLNNYPSATPPFLAACEICAWDTASFLLDKMDRVDDNTVLRGFDCLTNDTKGLLDHENFFLGGGNDPNARAVLERLVSGREMMAALYLVKIEEWDGAGFVLGKMTDNDFDLFCRMAQKFPFSQQKGEKAYYFNAALEKRLLQNALSTDNNSLAPKKNKL